MKIVYAQKDDDVSACMMEHGALAVLSLDGYMAVDIDAGSLAAGDKVILTAKTGSVVNLEDAFEIPESRP